MDKAVEWINKHTELYPLDKEAEYLRNRQELYGVLIHIGITIEPAIKDY
jgi:hypothetical protein